jgi:hypothetical protein
MARYVLIANNGPTDGEDDDADYNRWYDEVHVPDLLAVPGITSARRFRVVMSRRSNPPYLALYEIETDDLQSVMDHMGSGIRPFPPTFDGEHSEFVVAMALDDDGGDG